MTSQPRVMAVSVKHADGDWALYEALEIKVTEPIVVYSDTAGVVTISGGRLPEPPPASKP